MKYFLMKTANSASFCFLQSRKKKIQHKVTEQRDNGSLAHAEHEADVDSAVWIVQPRVCDVCHAGFKSATNQTNYTEARVNAADK